MKLFLKIVQANPDNLKIKILVFYDNIKFVYRIINRKKLSGKILILK